MRQLPLGYKPSYAGREAWLVMLEALRSAVHHLGLKEVTFELDVQKSTISDALNEKNDRRWANEWTHIVLAMLEQRHTETCDQLAKAILDAQAAVSTRFAVVEHDDISPEEVAAAERVLAAVRKRKKSAA